MKPEAKKIPRAIRLKRVKAQLSVLWSIAVRLRDGGRCVMCGKIEGLSAHHWFRHKSHSMALAFNVANGATLCYVDHLIKVHMRADGEHILRLCEIMTAKVGSAVVDEMREIARHPEPISLEWLEELRNKFLEARP